MEIKNLYDITSIKLVPGKEVFDNILKNSNFYVERIISEEICSSDDWIIQDWTELVFLLKGSATLIFEENKILEMKEGDYCLIPKQLPHKVLKTNDIQTIWLAIHYEES